VFGGLPAVQSWLTGSGGLREDAPPPIATTLFHLTDTGAELQPVLDAIGRWEVRYMIEPADGDQFRGHWFAFPASFFLHDRDASVLQRVLPQPVGRSAYTGSGRSFTIRFITSVEVIRWTLRCDLAGGSQPVTATYCLTGWGIG